MFRRMLTSLAIVAICIAVVNNAPDIDKWLRIRSL